MQVQQLIIELTGKCNLRCKYCIYNDYYEENRDFNTSDISFETAKKAIDYAYAHRHPDHFSITFYGGELKFFVHHESDINDRGNC